MRCRWEPDPWELHRGAGELSVYNSEYGRRFTIYRKEFIFYFYSMPLDLHGKTDTY